MITRQRFEELRRPLTERILDVLSATGPALSLRDLVGEVEYDPPSDEEANELAEVGEVWEVPLPVLAARKDAYLEALDELQKRGDVAMVVYNGQRHFARVR